MLRIVYSSMHLMDGLYQDWYAPSRTHNRERSDLWRAASPAVCGSFNGSAFVCGSRYPTPSASHNDSVAAWGISIPPTRYWIQQARWVPSKTYWPTDHKQNVYVFPLNKTKAEQVVVHGKTEKEPTHCSASDSITLRIHLLTTGQLITKT